MADINVPAAADGQRLDRWLKKQMPEVPYVAWQKMFRTGKVRVDGKRAKADMRLLAGMVVAVQNVEAKPAGAGQGAFQVTNADKALMKAAVVYEDDALLVLNKPAGLAAQAGSGQSRSVDRLLAAMYPDTPPKLTHRLDKDTTGLLVLAKTRAAAQAVTVAFAGREVKKVYLALLCGRLPGKQGDIHAPLAKLAHAHGSRAVVDDAGDKAHTSWKVVNEFDGLTLVEATPHTGRMNQLRAHFAHVGCPLVGDGKYGGEDCEDMAANLGFPRALYLHAWKLELPHPATGKPLRLTANLPEHFNTLT